MKLGLECIHCAQLSFSLPHAYKHKCSGEEVEDYAFVPIMVTWDFETQQWKRM